MNTGSDARPGANKPAVRCLNIGFVRGFLPASLHHGRHRHVQLRRIVNLFVRDAQQLGSY